MFLAWFEANKLYLFARELKYTDSPQKFIFKTHILGSPKNKDLAIGRIMHCPPSRRDDYYLRMLRNCQRGCTCYKDIKMVNNIVYPTYKEACYALGLLDEDNEYIDAINKESKWASGDYIRRLFVMLLIANCLSTPAEVWNSCWPALVEDMLYRQ